MRLWTSLLDAEKYPAAELLALYGQRWEVEISIKEVKVELRGSDRLASYTPETAAQEIAALLLAQSVLVQARCAASQQGEVAALRISFRETVRLAKRCSELGYELTEDETKQLYERFIALADRKKEVFDDDLHMLILGVQQESFELYHLVQVRCAASQKGEVAALRISFRETVRLVRAVWTWLVVGEGLYTKRQSRVGIRRLIRRLSQQVTPERRARSCPRGLRQPVSSWPRVIRRRETHGKFQYEIIPHRVSKP